ncbi:Gfo/Idh/MocA family protein [Dyadobacter luticola]|uniref:Gfo/Idh/MocA family oxidoreductase n=1 Tax=Dyadobacter luticola TaxID=1979387 RepID=A0A5R9L2M5_9BACT|nr:Gfo/Idh/MocA family oxidoreductase [Dyadobacter luticola]TLV02832.1 Gfo/Idh/MocA family oxidoreductase [Dyadobacter luticola]
MVKVALIGAGKMGISHLAILGAHPNVEVVGVSDTSKMVLDVFGKYSSFPCFTNYEEMIKVTKPDAVFVAVPTKYHATMVRKVLESGKHVFAEKPFCLTSEEGKELAGLAKEKKLVNQVGYHNKFIGTFKEVKRILDMNALGKVVHFTGESYGPVVIREKAETWRSNPEEGGGCLMDYASHVIDLINYLLGTITSVKGAMLESIYSKNVEDAVFCMLELSTEVTGILSVNWSDETYRKMSTSITILGKKGKIICDANELKVYFKSHDCPEGYTKGWNIRNVTDLTDSVDFYLRGEEYSAQIDHFINAVQNQTPSPINDFYSAWQTDHAISLIKKNSIL